MTDRHAVPVQELDEVTAAARGEFGDLTVEQLNWRPAEGRWSIAQCLDHLITMNGLYFPVFTALRNGDYRPSFAARWSPFSGPLGRALISSTRPESVRKVKTGPRAQPSSSEIAGDIVERFAAHQSQLIEKLQGIPATTDWKRTIITSPLLGFVTYSLEDCVTLLVVHEERHLQQARAVLGAPEFPRASPGGQG